MSWLCDKIIMDNQLFMNNNIIIRYSGRKYNLFQKFIYLYLIKYINN